MASKQSYRAYMFTLPNYSRGDIPRMWSEHLEFCVWQAEQGEGGLHHLQGYFVLKANPTNKNGRTMAWVKKTIDPYMHIEPRRGTHAQAVAYCTKDDTRVNGPWQYGSWDDTVATAAGRAKGSTKGGASTKANCAQLMVAVKSGMDDTVLQDKFPALYMQYHKAIERVRLTVAQSTPRPQPFVICYWGPTGTGKSHKADSIKKAWGGGISIRQGNGGNLWFDAYDPLRHPVVIFDEMDGSFMPYRRLLRICDKWELVVDTKGGAVSFIPKVILFTSHKHPKDWYSPDTVPDTSELMRRLTGTYGAIKHMTETFITPVTTDPDLIDQLEIIETNRHAKPLIPVAAAPPIDLTSDEDFDDKSPIDHELEDHMQCGYCERTLRDCICATPEGSEDYNPDIDHCDVCGHIEDECTCDYNRDVGSFPPADGKSQAEPLREAKRLKRTDTTAFKITPPPVFATAADFRRHKQIPGQSRLDLIKKAAAVEDIDE